MEDKQQEDLDMLYVLKSIKKGIANFFNGIAWLLQFSYKKAKGLIIFMTVSTLVCFGIYTLQTPYYNSELIISHTRFENDFCSAMIDNLNSYIGGTSNNSEIAEKLSLSETEALAIRSLKYSPANEELAKKYADSLFIFLPFKVEAEVYDNNVLDNLQKGIMNYLETNEYALKRREIDKQSLVKTEAKIKSEIVEIDSLKQLINQSIVPRGSGNGIILGEPIDPVNVYRRGFELYEKQLVLNKKQELNNSFEVIVGFIKKPVPANLGLLFYLFFGALCGYIVGIIWFLKRQTHT
jgi:hypothetical protein